MFKMAPGLILVLLVCGTALGGLATDSNAYDDGTNPQWHGSTHFYSVHPGDPGIYLEADVEWAVYASGDFSYPGAG